MESQTSFLFQEYSRWRALFQAQPGPIQQFLVGQAQQLAEALTKPLDRVQITFPEQVVTPASGTKPTLIVAVPPKMRKHLIGGLLNRLSRTSLETAVRDRLDELDASASMAVACSSGLLRFTAATYMLHELLPAGQPVVYLIRDNEETTAIPSRPDLVISAEPDVEPDNRLRGSLDVPGEIQARLLGSKGYDLSGFFQPRWVAIDDCDRLLVDSLEVAGSHLTAMQWYIRVLQTAVQIAPYIVVDEQYQEKWHGMLSQLVHQGRALARYKTRLIMTAIHQRAKANSLNRGLSLSLPYFDDQVLEMKYLFIEIIPPGRVLFIPSFVVLAVRNALARVERDVSLTRSTRNHLLQELRMLEIYFFESGS